MKQPYVDAAPQPLTVMYPGMEYASFDAEPVPVSVHLSRFSGPSGVDEYNLMVQPTEYASIETQLEWVESGYRSALAACGLADDSAVFRRFLCSDLPNQASALAARPFSNPGDPGDPCAVSWVGQPPLPPQKVALWAWHVADPAGPLDKRTRGTTLSLRRGALTHHWTTALARPDVGDSYAQTQAVFADYEAFLSGQGLTLIDHVLRTWLFVQNVDANYAGLVTARRELFGERGLTADTHYIASTGIEGDGADVRTLVAMDAYAIDGVRPEQIEHLQALDHLSPTHVYGVTFERATAIAYRDRKHILVSGTASIDHHGEIVHPGDVARQLDRTLENVEALLAQGGATLDDMGLFLVYVRDPADSAVALPRLRERFGAAPLVVVVAPVCRPGWLIEIEGMAVVPASNPGLPEW